MTYRLRKVGNQWHMIVLDDAGREVERYAFDTFEQADSAAKSSGFIDGDRGDAI